MAKLVIKGSGLRDEVLKLKEGVNRIGRSAANDFVLLDSTISRFHCEVTVGVEAMSVRDLDSANGTFVDEQMIEQSELRTGQTLRLGDVAMEVREAPEPAEQGAVVMCTNHPTYPANMECTQCHKVFCGSCVHVLRRSGGKFLRLCPLCSGHCVPLEQTHQDAKGFLKDIVNKFLKKRPEDRYHD